MATDQADARNLPTVPDVPSDERVETLDNRVGSVRFLPDRLAGVIRARRRGPHDGPRRAW